VAKSGQSLKAFSLTVLFSPIGFGFDRIDGHMVFAGWIRPV